MNDLLLQEAYQIRRCLNERYAPHVGDSTPFLLIGCSDAVINAYLIVNSYINMKEEDRNKFLFSMTMGDFVDGNAIIQQTMRITSCMENNCDINGTY